MKDFLTADHIIEEKIDIDGIPALLLMPNNKEELLHTIIFYHGWGSNKEGQRLRAFILASLGYQVIIPDAINHGERGLLNYLDPNNVRDHFWPVVFNNIEESKRIINYLVKNHKANPDTLSVMGHSMGGFTSAGIFTQDESVKTMVVVNGSCNWEHTNSIFKQNPAFQVSADYEELEKKIYSLDPMNNLHKLVNRSMLLLHGEADSVVPISSQRIFYSKIKEMYDYPENINFIEYPNLDHYLTTDMMEQSVRWLKRIL